MYPIICRGGYGVPLKAGKFEICHIVAVASDVSSTSRLTFVDDSDIVQGSLWGNFIDSKLSKHTLVFDKSRVAACEANIEMKFAEPLKVRDGLSVLNAINLVPGSIFVYVR